MCFGVKKGRACNFTHAKLRSVVTRRVSLSLKLDLARNITPLPTRHCQGMIWITSCVLVEARDRGIGCHLCGPLTVAADLQTVESTGATQRNVHLPVAETPVGIDVHVCGESVSG